MFAMLSVIYTLTLMWDIYALICASIKFYWIEINHYAFPMLTANKIYFIPVQNKCHSKSRTHSTNAQ